MLPIVETQSDNAKSWYEKQLEESRKQYTQESIDFINYMFSEDYFKNIFKIRKSFNYKK